MKKLITIFVLTLLILQVTACVERTGLSDPTAAPTAESTEISAPVLTDMPDVTVSSTNQPTAEPTSAPTVAPTEAAAPQTQYGRFVEILSVPVGEGEFDVHYQYPTPGFDEDLTGPNAFQVIGDEVWILDTVDNSLLRLCGGEKHRYPLEGIKHVENFYIVGSHIFITEAWYGDKLYVYDMDVKLEKGILLPSGVRPNSAAVYQIYEADEEGCIIVLTSGMDYLKCNIETGEWRLIYRAKSDPLSPVKAYDFNGTQFSFEAGENTISHFLSADLENGTIFVAILEILSSEDGTINIRTSYRQYDTAGNLLRYADLVRDPAELTWLFREYTAPNGDYYILQGYEDRVVISKLVFDSAKINQSNNK